MNMRPTTTARIAAVLLTGALAGAAEAGPFGMISTDRFGYTGTVWKYDTLANAQANDGATGLLDTIAIGNRDLSLYSSNGMGGDANIAMGSWWYTIEDPYKGDGWGNTRGNTGVGFVQLYDSDGSTDSSVDMSFGDFDGTYWTSFSLDLSGGGADYASDFARFSPFASNVNDQGIYHEYALSLQAMGLEGLETAPGLIEAFDHPDAVTGSYSGIFENNTASANQGFYVFSLALDMTNWAYDNRNLLTGPNDYNQFADSYFATLSPVPEPATLSMAAMALGIVGWRRRRQA